MPTKTLDTNASNFTKVFRRIVSQLHHDDRFRGIVGKELRSWDGSDRDRQPATPSEGQPIVRLTPIPSGVAWRDESSQVGTLNVRVELFIAGTCIDDVNDLWDTIVTALRPADEKFTKALKDLGAETGEILFATPAVDATPEKLPDGQMIGMGSFQLAVWRFVNP
jgi:hypothetical protein